MKAKLLIEAVILFTLGHIIMWYQSNSQFFSEWAKNHRIILACSLGPIVSYLFIVGVGYVAEATTGQMWPTRIVPSIIGTIVFMIMTYAVFREGVDLKNGICLVLTLVVMFIQVFWK